MNLPMLPTTVVGSYSMPGWLERLKTEYFARRISRRDLDEIHDTAVKAAVKDQENAGIDIITDGELRRDNMVDYFVEKLPGVQIDHASKKFYYDLYESKVLGKLPTAPLGLVDDFRFLRDHQEVVLGVRGVPLPRTVQPVCVHSHNRRYQRYARSRIRPGTGYTIAHADRR